MSRFCRNCGAELARGTKFCGICGAKTPENREKHPKQLWVLVMAAVLVIALTIVILPKLGNDDGSVGSAENQAGDLSIFSYNERDYKAQEKEVTITEKDPTASAYGVRVKFGEYNIEGSETLAIRALPEKTDKTNSVKVIAYDFSMDGRTSFDDVITIAIPYDEKYVESGAEGECVGAKYYNETTEEWEAVPYALDVSNHQVLIYTTHLSTYGVFQVKNENTRKAYINDVYALAGLLGENKSYDVLKELTENGQPGNAAFEAGFAAVNGVVGDIGTAVTAATLGGQYDGALADTLGKAAQHTGLALSIVQTCYDFTYNFSDDSSKMSTLANLVKNAANNAVGYFGSAAMQVGFSGVYVFDILLSTVQSDMVELKLENIGEVYQYYNDVESPRSNKEWRALFIRIIKNNPDDPQKAKQLIEKEIDDYCNRFWNLGYGKIKEIAGVSGKKYSFDERNYTKDREVLTEQYKAHLMERLQAPLTSARNYLLNQASEASQKELENHLRSLKKELNRTVKVKITEQPEKDGDYQYAGFSVRFAPLSSKANKNNWRGVMPKSGTLNTSFTILGHIQSGLPNTIELYAPGSNAPAVKIPFKVSYPTTDIVIKSNGKDEAMPQQTDRTTPSEESSTQTQPVQEYAWILVGTEDFDSAEKWEIQNQQVSYSYEYSYSRGSYSAKQTFIGESDDYYNPPVIKGEGLGLQAIFRGVPKIIRPDESVSITLSLSATENTQSFYSFSGSANAAFDEPGIEAGMGTGNAIEFKNEKNKSYFEISKGTGYASVNETLTAKLGAGNEGDRIALRTSFTFGVSMCTNYVYEWKPVAGIESIVNIP